MLRFNKILCPVDFDPNSLQALRPAGEISRERHATLHVLHVVEVAIPAKVEAIAPFDKMEAAITSKPKQLTRQKIDARVRRELHVETSDPGVEVLDAAKPVGCRSNCDGNTLPKRTSAPHSRQCDRAHRSRGAVPRAYRKTGSQAGSGGARESPMKESKKH